MCSVIGIIRLKGSVMVWPKVIPLNGVHCICKRVNKRLVGMSNLLWKSSCCLHKSRFFGCAEKKSMQIFMRGMSRLLACHVTGFQIGLKLKTGGQLIEFHLIFSVDRKFLLNLAFDQNFFFLEFLLLKSFDQLPKFASYFLAVDRKF
jgi:hypothetical protein